MTELASINAIVRRKEGRRTRYFMNPNIATHIPTPEQRAAARTPQGRAGPDAGGKDRNAAPGPLSITRAVGPGGVYGGG